MIEKQLKHYELMLEFNLKQQEILKLDEVDLRVKIKQVSCKHIWKTDHQDYTDPDDGDMMQNTAQGEVIICTNCGVIQ